MDNTMNIFVAFNDAYSIPAGIMLRSLIENNLCTLDIYVLYITLSDKSKETILRLKNDRVTIRFIQVNNRDFGSVPIIKYFSKDAYIRLFAHLYLPDCLNRILWLDSDLIINGSIHEYYEQSFEGKLFIADRDIDIWDSLEKKKSLGMPSDAVYINSGVLLMNLQEIRNKIRKEDIIEYIEDYYCKIEYADQDVFNGLMYDDFKIVDPEYIYNFHTRRITPQNKRQVYQNVRILHYLGEEKPWKKKYAYYGFDIWWKYALMTDKRYIDLYKDIRYSCWKARKTRILKWYKRRCSDKYPIIKRMVRIIKGA